VFDRALSAGGRVRVLLELIGRLVPVDLDVGQVHARGGRLRGAEVRSGEGARAARFKHSAA
jgi:hypothetical protein